MEKVNEFYIQASVIMTKHIINWKKRLLRTKNIAEERMDTKSDTCVEAVSDSMVYSESYCKRYTLNVLGMLDIINTRWIYGITKRNFDLLIQIRFWAQGMDTTGEFGCSIGELVERDNVVDIRWSDSNNQTERALEAGMVVGIKIDSHLQKTLEVQNENILLLKKQKNESVPIICVENLTFIPLDKEALDASYMNHEDIVRINNYQQSVYDVVSPYLTQEEQQWLAKECEKIAFG